METIVECVPNFSEGRDRKKVEEIAAAIGSVPEVFVLDIHMDADHHRSVITFAGTKESAGEAAVRGVGRAAELIDLNRHQGEHPRMGAADVVPFVPLRGVGMEECVRLAHDAGKEIFRRFQIPVYFYGYAALRPERASLPTVRRGGLEESRRIGPQDSSRLPDIGEAAFHPTAGATAVGARPLLIAFNVNLNSGDRKAAQEIARTIRASGGGLPALQAIGVLLQSRRLGGQPGQAQVAMNLTDVEQTSLVQAFQAVQQEAARIGVSISSTELVGLIPEKALAGVTPESLQIVNFDASKILENKLAELSGSR